jgi:hypothetical protein
MAFAESFSQIQPPEQRLLLNPFTSEIKNEQAGSMRIKQFKGKKT